MKIHCPDKPSDCALALAVPLRREQFFADLTDERKDFVRQWVGSFPGYPVEQLWKEYSLIAGYAATLAAEAQRRDTIVKTDTTLKDVGTLVRCRKVVTLIAHWCERRESDGYIEFADGVCPVGDLLPELPDRYEGTIDLTVCYSVRLISAIKRARPFCTILSNRGRARLNVRLAMYRQIQGLLETEYMTYVEAAAKVHLAALEIT